MPDQQTTIESHIRQAKPRQQILYPYTEFDLVKAKKQLCDQFKVCKLGYYRSIIELIMNKQNLQFKKETHSLNPQIGYGETIALSDVYVAEQVGCSIGIVGDCRRYCKKVGLWSVARAKGKHGNSRCGIWVYVFIGYLTLQPEQPKEIVVHEVEDNILEIDFERSDRLVGSEEKVALARNKSSEYSEKTVADRQPSDTGYDKVFSGSAISAKKTILKKEYSSSIEGTNGEEEDKFKAEKPVEYTRNEPVQIVPSIVEETLIKVSAIRMDSKGNSNPVDEAEKPQFRIWLDDYAKTRSKDLDITYEEALEILPVAWQLATRFQQHYRPDTPCYFNNGRSNQYAKPYLYDALKTVKSGGESEQQEQETEMDIDTILGQDYEDKPSNSEEEEVQMYIRKYRQLLIRRQANDGTALMRVMHNLTAQKLGEETVMRLLKVEGIG